MKKPSTYERDDRGPVENIIDGINGYAILVETMLIMEKYGLSLVFDDETIEWLVSDPKNLFRARNNTPSGAIIMWDEMRKEEEEREGNLKIVE